MQFFVCGNITDMNRENKKSHIYLICGFVGYKGGSIIIVIDTKWH